MCGLVIAGEWNNQAGCRIGSHTRSVPIRCVSIPLSLQTHFLRTIDNYNQRSFSCTSGVYMSAAASLYPVTNGTITTSERLLSTPSLSSFTVNECIVADQDECQRGCWFVPACGGYGTETTGGGRARLRPVHTPSHRGGMGLNPIVRASPSSAEAQLSRFFIYR